MASTGFRNGTDLSIFIGGTEVAFATTHDLDLGMDTREVTNKDSAGWQEIREGTRNWSTSGEAWFAEDAAYGFSDLFALYNSRSSFIVKFSTNVSGDVYYTGTAYLTSLTQSDPLEDTASFSFSLDGTGVLTEATLT
jgi:predicted secreted protein